MTAPDSSQPSDGGGGWVILGLMNEILLKLVSQPDLASLWGEVCAGARTILRVPRFCVLLAADDGTAQLVVRDAAGEVELGAPEGSVVVDAWLHEALQSQRPAWLKGPWDEARRVDLTRSWLLADNPEVIFHVPIQIYQKTIGTLLFALDDQRQVDRKTLASMTTFALYVGTTYTMLKSSLELAGASERLREQNEELELVQVELRRQLEVIGVQHDELLLMSTPILQVWDSVLALPVIGTVDGARASRMMEEVLAAIVRQSARFMIVDLTGAQASDASTVDHLLRIFAAAKLLGSQCVLSGVPIPMIEHILEGGGDVGGIPVFSTLRRALQHVMSAMRIKP